MYRRMAGRSTQKRKPKLKRGGRKKIVRRQTGRIKKPVAKRVPYGRQPYGRQPYGEPAYGQQPYGQPAYGQQPNAMAPPVQITQVQDKTTFGDAVKQGAGFGLGFGALDVVGNAAGESFVDMF